jgi:hypothetical protein
MNSANRCDLRFLVGAGDRAGRWTTSTEQYAASRRPAKPTVSPAYRHQSSSDDLAQRWRLSWNLSSYVG